MAKFDSSVSSFILDDESGTPRDITPYLTDVSGFPGTRNLNEVTALGDSGTKYAPGIQNTAPSISGHFDTTANVGTDIVLKGLFDHTAAVTAVYSPSGTGSGAVKYSAEVWVTDYSISSSVGSHVTFSASLQVNGTVAVGTN